jgi:sugar phosphate isomerase/epimerase
MNRREWQRRMLAGLTGFVLSESSLARTPGCSAAGGDPTYKGVNLGIQSYSLRDRPLKEAVEAMKQVGIKSCELWSGHVEPKGIRGAELSGWRSRASLTEFTRVKQLFDRAGITLSAYSAGFRSEMTDEEVDKVFLMAKALGVEQMTSSATVEVTPRVDRFAQKHKIRVGLHNHDKFEDQNEISNTDSFQRALKSASDYMAINLDIGHLVAANEDPVAFIKKHHNRILMLHVKDRKKNHGDNTVFGEGDTPIAAVLRLLRDRKLTFPANIEYEYNGSDTVMEIKRCLAYCRQTLV